MRYDFSPFYRSTVGFDRLFDLLDQNSIEPTTNWPPYNIDKIGDDQFRITMAVAGFTPDEIQLVQHGNNLLISGQKKREQEGVQTLHRGIATRTFKQTFNIADHVKVVSATLENGLLTVDLQRQIPEALKPRRIEISSSSGQSAGGQDNVRQVDQPKAA